jgi:hypothetical protein
MWAIRDMHRHAPEASSARVDPLHRKSVQLQQVAFTKFDDATLNQLGDVLNLL